MDASERVDLGRFGGFQFGCGRVLISVKCLGRRPINLFRSEFLILFHGMEHSVRDERAGGVAETAQSLAGSLVVISVAVVGFFHFQAFAGMPLSKKCQIKDFCHEVGIGDAPIRPEPLSVGHTASLFLCQYDMIVRMIKPEEHYQVSLRIKKSAVVCLRMYRFIYRLCWQRRPDFPFQTEREKFRIATTRVCQTDQDPAERRYLVACGVYPIFQIVLTWTWIGDELDLTDPDDRRFDGDHGVRLTQGRVGGNFGGTQLSRHDIALAPVNYPHEYAHDYLSSTHKDEPESKVGTSCWIFRLSHSLGFSSLKKSASELVDGLVISSLEDADRMAMA